MKIKNIFNFLPAEASAFLIGTKDEFLLEYPPAHSRRLEFITGFTGSNGIAILTKNGKSHFFTDGRYLLQSANELDDLQFESPIEISKFYDFCAHNLKDIIYFDPKLHSISFLESLQKRGVLLKEVDVNPIEKIWHDRPTPFIYEQYDFKLAGEESKSKIEKVSLFLDSQKADAIFIFDLTEVSWLLNIRGNYLECTPLTKSFVIVSRETFKIIKFDDLESISSLKLNKIIVSKSASYYCYNVLKQVCQEVIFDTTDFISNLKSVKTESEIECIKRAHLEDGRALNKFIDWVRSREASNKLESETEFSLGKKLEEFRSKAVGYKGESFPVICAFKENGAIIHYRAPIDGSKEIKGSGLLLIDSGAQYYNESLKICGTTDVTRVLSIGGLPKPEEKRIYTLVLKGHIALEEAIFPEGTTGADLDILARQFLFQNGENYSHGTGHGVGYFLSVHEGPVGISKACSKAPLKAGMVISNEPGFYKEGQYGIRIESLLLVCKSEFFPGFLHFETLTRVGLERSLLDYDILTDSEIDWLVKYHEDLPS